MTADTETGNFFSVIMSITGYNQGVQYFLVKLR